MLFNERILKAHKLILSAETNYFVCKTIQEAKGSTHTFSRSDFLLLASNNSFDASVGILHTLLSSSIRKEIRLDPILRGLISECRLTYSTSSEKIEQYRLKLEKLYPDLRPVDCTFLRDDGDSRHLGDVLKEVCRSKLITTGLNDLQSLRNEFVDSHLTEIRHQLVAHKNAQQFHLGDTANVFIKDSTLTSLGKIIKTLRINACFWLGYSPENPDLQHVLNGVRRALDAESANNFRA
ncbi:hypothetical protein KBC59_00425 [Patescibacteria group bacterium]|jgi:hypothetical protein|nr:hypothetical protein [Patescibacteria group bacterium]